MENSGFFCTFKDTSVTAFRGGWKRCALSSFYAFILELEQRQQTNVFPITRAQYFDDKKAIAEGTDTTGAKASEVANCKSRNGGFCPFLYANDERKKDKIVGYAPMVVIDCDHVPAPRMGDILQLAEQGKLGQCCIYLTASDEGQKASWRKLRIVVGLDRAPVGVFEWEAVTRSIAHRIDPCMGQHVGAADKDWVDPASFRLNQCMFWPASWSDDPDETRMWAFTAGEPLSIDQIRIEDYPHGLDANTAGLFKTSEEIRRQMQAGDALSTVSVNRGGASATDPRNSSNDVIAAFCRRYSVADAIARWGHGYRPSEGQDNRWDWTEGTGAKGGLILYPDQQRAYSFDATSPLSTGHSVNAFDIFAIFTQGGTSIEKTKAAIREAKTLPGIAKDIQKAQADRFVAAVQQEGQTPSPKSKKQSPLPSTLDRCPAAQDQVDEDPKKQLIFTDQGQLVNCVTNVAALMALDPSITAADVHKDIFLDRVVISHPDRLPWPSSGEWRDSDDACLRSWLEGKQLMASKINVLDGFDTYISRRQQDSAAEAFQKLQWDGVKRLDAVLTDWMGSTDDPAYTAEVLKRCMIAEVARILHPGQVKFDCMLLLIGPQGCGKSTFAEKLAMRREWYVPLNEDVTAKDTRAKLLGHIIADMGELTSLNKSDQEANKDFISATADTFRAPYAKRPETHVRRAMLIGSTNNDTPLVDVTGNRRYLPVHVSLVASEHGCKIHDATPEEVEQWWAEAKALAEQKIDNNGKEVEAWQVVGAFPTDFFQKAAEQQQQAMWVDPLAEVIQRYLTIAWPDEARDWKADRRARFFLWRTGAMRPNEQSIWESEVDQMKDSATGSLTWWEKVNANADDDHLLASGGFHQVIETSVGQIYAEALGNYGRNITKKDAARIRGILMQIPDWERGGRVYPEGQGYKVSNDGYRLKTPF